MPSPIILIPVYQGTPNRTESASLRQCLEVLGRHPIVFATFPELDLTAYRTIVESFSIPFRVEYFDKSFFASLEAYNRLCLLPDFYRRFAADHDYMLVYQLDAWVFRDELDDWCAKGYDYVGAPWILGQPQKASQLRFKAVGNGGFSLRKISFCLRTLEASGSIITPAVLKALIRDRACGAVARKFPIYRTQEHLLQAARNGKLYEDTVFSLQKYTSLQAAIPSPDEALAFSFERQPALLYERNGGQLPFGCHAWQLPSHLAFWQSWISLHQVEAL